MSQHPGRPRLAKPEPFSQWANKANKDLSVTRGELLAILLNFKRQLEDERWHRRLLRALRPKRDPRPEDATPQIIGILK